MEKKKNKLKRVATGVARLMNKMKTAKIQVDEDLMLQFSNVTFTDQDFDTKSSEIRRVCTAFFEIVDADQSGEMSVVEFMTALRVIGERLGKKFQYPSAMSLFARLDLDQGGSIDIDELVAGMAVVRDCQFIEICYAVQMCHEHSIHLDGLDDFDDDGANPTTKTVAPTTFTSEAAEKALAEYAHLKHELRAKSVEAARLLRRSTHAETSLENHKVDLQGLREQIKELKQSPKEIQHEQSTLAESSKKLKDAEKRIEALQEQLAVRDDMLKRTNAKAEKDKNRLVSKMSRDRNDAARERKLRRNSLAMGNVYKTKDHEEHILELSQKVAVLTAREKHAVSEAAKYQDLAEHLKYEVVRLGGQLVTATDDLNNAQVESQDKRVTQLRLLERKVINDERKIKRLEMELASSSKNEVPAELKIERLAEKDFILQKLTAQNKKLLDKVDRLQVDNSKVSAIFTRLTQSQHIFFFSFLLCHFLTSHSLRLPTVFCSFLICHPFFSPSSYFNLPMW